MMIYTYNVAAHVGMLPSQTTAVVYLEGYDHSNGKRCDTIKARTWPSNFWNCPWKLKEQSCISSISSTMCTISPDNIANTWHYSCIENCAWKAGDVQTRAMFRIGRKSAVVGRKNFRTVLCNAEHPWKGSLDVDGLTITCMEGKGNVWNHRSLFGKNQL